MVVRVSELICEEMRVRRDDRLWQETVVEMVYPEDGVDRKPLYTRSKTEELLPSTFNRQQRVFSTDDRPPSYQGRPVRLRRLHRFYIVLARKIRINSDQVARIRRTIANSSTVALYLAQRRVSPIFLSL